MGIMPHKYLARLLLGVSAVAALSGAVLPVVDPVGTLVSIPVSFAPPPP